jgi:hypothetical protein
MMVSYRNEHSKPIGIPSFEQTTSAQIDLDHDLDIEPDISIGRTDIEEIDVQRAKIPRNLNRDNKRSYGIEDDGGHHDATNYSTNRIQPASTKVARKKTAREKRSAKESLWIPIPENGSPNYLDTSSQDTFSETFDSMTTEGFSDEGFSGEIVFDFEECGKFHENSVFKSGLIDIEVEPFDDIISSSIRPSAYQSNLF